MLADHRGPRMPRLMAGEQLHMPFWHLVSSIGIKHAAFGSLGFAQSIVAEALRPS